MNLVSRDLKLYLHQICFKQTGWIIILKVVQAMSIWSCSLYLVLPLIWKAMTSHTISIAHLSAFGFAISVTPLPKTRHAFGLTQWIVRGQYQKTIDPIQQTNKISLSVRELLEKFVEKLHCMNQFCLIAESFYFWQKLVIW